MKRQTDRLQLRSKAASIGCALTTLALLTSTCLCRTAEPAKPEVEVGYGLDRLHLEQHLIVFDPQAESALNRIGQRVAKASERQDFKYTFRILNDEQVNAFATAGGFVYVNTGLLDFCESEEELASVLAHELVHLEGNHLVEDVNHRRSMALTAEILGYLIQAGAMAGSIAAGGGGAGTDFGSQLASQTAQQGISAGQQLGNILVAAYAQASVLGYSKEHELEADRKAVTLMVRSSYDPNALVRFLDKLQGLRDRMIANHEVLATALINAQPGLEERIKILKASNPDASPAPQPQKQEKTEGKP